MARTLQLGDDGRRRQEAAGGAQRTRQAALLPRAPHGRALRRPDDVGRQRSRLGDRLLARHTAHGVTPTAQELLASPSKRSPEQLDRARDRAPRMATRTVAFDGTPCFWMHAKALERARRRGWQGTLNSGDRRKGVAERYGKQSQAKLYACQPEQDSRPARARARAATLRTRPAGRATSCAQTDHRSSAFLPGTTFTPISSGWTARRATSSSRCCGPWATRSSSRTTRRRRHTTSTSRPTPARSSTWRTPSTRTSQTCRRSTSPDAIADRTSPSGRASHPTDESPRPSCDESTSACRPRAMTITARRSSGGRPVVASTTSSRSSTTPNRATSSRRLRRSRASTSPTTRGTSTGRRSATPGYRFAFVRATYRRRRQGLPVRPRPPEGDEGRRHRPRLLPLRVSERRRCARPRSRPAFRRRGGCRS